jgi:hypothetical protein
MATLESDKVDKALRSKMQASRIDTGDWYYLIKDGDGIVIASTSLSKGGVSIHLALNVYQKWQGNLI